MSDHNTLLGNFFTLQKDAMREVMAAWEKAATNLSVAVDDDPWSQSSKQLQEMWNAFQTESGGILQGSGALPAALNPEQWIQMTQGLMRSSPLPTPDYAVDNLKKFVTDSMEIWQGVLSASLGTSTQTDNDAETDTLPRKDRRFSDAAWREHPAYALLHQSYLMLAEYFTQAAREAKGVPDDKRAQLRHATQSLVDAMSPDNFLATNPVVMKRTIETGGQNLVKGMRHLIRDLQKGQLTHTDSDAFILGENLAATPGKVIHETPLYQLIQYGPTTEDVLDIPLLIFPPWINRFYILDLTPRKSYIKWAVDQGLSVFVVSWKSADSSMKDIIWDDYIRAQIGAIDHVRTRLKVPSVHTIGYCVAGTTLAATLAILARRGEAEKVKTATFFTAQVDFEYAGELKNFIENEHLGMIESLTPNGYLDGRYLAATFNVLRSKDLIWNYVVNNYLLGQDYPAFDLLHWNGDVTNLPAKWHSDYLRDLYRDNKLVQPDALSADGTPIDLTKIETPAYIQAGREDHIAPAVSVWEATKHFRGDTEFLLAGSGHIAGVVNPPHANKYQYWTGDSSAKSLDDFIEGATEHPGSWWPHWIKWIRTQDAATVPVKGKRKPGGRGDKIIENAPGRYVMMR